MRRGSKMMADAIVTMGVPGILVPIIIGVIMRFPSRFRYYCDDYRFGDYRPHDRNATGQPLSGGIGSMLHHRVSQLPERFLLPRGDQLLRHGYHNQSKNVVRWLYSGSGFWISYFCDFGSVLFIKHNVAFMTN